jgi:hypothetical protein
MHKQVNTLTENLKSASIRTSTMAGVCALPISRESLSEDMEVPDPPCTASHRGNRLDFDHELRAIKF